MASVESSTVHDLESSIQEVQQKLADAEIKLEKADALKKRKYSDIIRRCRTKLHQLLERRKVAEQIPSVDEQIQDFGKERWDEMFRMLRDIQEVDGLTAEGEKLQENIWNAVPNTRFKRFQEAFSDPQNFIVPHFEVNGKRILFSESKKDLNGMPLGGLLVSPERIPDELAVDLKLAEFEKNESMESKTLKKSKKIGQLKEIFETAEQLQENHHRLLVIRTQEDAGQNIMQDVQGADPAINGSILYTRQKSSAEPHQLTVQFFEDAYAAQRKTFHEEKIYMGEINELASISHELRSIRTELNRDWNERKDELVPRAKEVIGKCVEALEDCEDVFKVKAHGLMSAIQNFKDSTGKTNVTASLTRITTAINALELRLKTMRPIAGYNSQDRLMLEQTIQDHEQMMQDYRSGIYEFAQRLMRNPALLGEEDLSESQLQSQVRGIMTPIHLDKLRRVKVAPFIVYADQFREKHAAMKDALLSRNADTAKDLAISMHVIGKFFEVQKRFENIKRDVIDSRHISVSQIRTFVSDLKLQFSTYQILEDRKVESYVDPFEAMQKELVRIEERLREYEGEDPDLTEKDEMFQRLKKYLERFDITQIVRDLP